MAIEPKTFYRAANMFDDGNYNMPVCGDLSTAQAAEIEARNWKRGNPRARYGVFRVTNPGNITLIKEIHLD